MKSQDFKFTSGVVGYPMLFGLLIWYVFWIDKEFGLGLKSFGIRPLELEGLIGIVMSPFLHGDVGHLWNNTIPLMVLSAALFYFYRTISWKVLGYGILLSGFFTWLIGGYGNHIGASGLIYVLASFIFFKGILAKNYRLIALSMLVVFLYGSMIWYIFPVKPGMSWEGHLSGAVTGLLFAVLYRRAIIQPKQYVWEDENYDEDNDPFMQHFDEEGNFVSESEQKRMEELEEIERIQEQWRQNQDHTL
ncbi:rhomboid family intramembrane serine protease [Sungkyunkwania multivorans]|uniref:Rhomboid family intramembrane serine protease n=1 Tax=Sungkyunkwania multivorans TaxID=1173618 RepID=A0ABW3CU54_9FLAO